jgi:hypothetical protein
MLPAKVSCTAQPVQQAPANLLALTLLGQERTHSRTGAVLLSFVLHGLMVVFDSGLRPVCGAAIGSNSSNQPVSLPISVQRSVIT